MASTSLLDHPNTLQNDGQKAEKGVKVSDNIERGPSSVAARIAQIGMKIPVGPPGVRILKYTLLKW